MIVAPALPDELSSRAGGGSRMGMLAAARRYTDERVSRAEVRAATARQERIVLRGKRPVEQLARVHVEAWLAGLRSIAVSTRRTYFGMAPGQPGGEDGTGGGRSDMTAPYAQPGPHVPEREEAARQARRTGTDGRHALVQHRGIRQA